MNEVFKKLLESNLLTEETVAALEETIGSYIQESVAQAREQAITEAQIQLAKQWETERTALVEAIEAKLLEQYEPEAQTLKETIEQFENMKVALSKKMLKQERVLKEQVVKEMKTLAKDIDNFLGDIVVNEMTSIKSDIQKIKEDNFGRRIFKSFMQEYAEKHFDGAKIEENIKALRAKLDESLAENAKLKQLTAQADRKTKVAKLLAPLTGETRKVMEAVLADVPTEKLDESYKTFLSRVLRSPEKEGPKQVLAETKTDKSKKAQAKNAVTEGVKVTGDSVPLPARKTQVNEDVELERSLNTMRKLAGLA